MSIMIITGRLRTTVLALLAASGIALAGCISAPPPVQEMSDARQAVAAARDAGADQLAPQIYARSVSLLEKAESTLARRGFRQARDQALASRRLAIEAMETAAAQRQGPQN